MPSARTPDPAPSGGISRVSHLAVARPGQGRPSASRSAPRTAPAAAALPPGPPRPLRLLERLLRRPPSAGCAWSRYPAAGRLMTARCTVPRARRRARYPCQPVRRPGPGSTGRRRAARSFSRVQRGPPAEGTADPAVAWSRQFAQVVAEILAGARSPRQLAPWTTERVRERISLLTQTLAPGQKPRIRRIVTSRPAARVVEMTVVLSFGPRSRALALRLEQLPGRRPLPGCRPPGAMALHRNRGRLERPL